MSENTEDHDGWEKRDNIWARGLFMLVFMFLVAIAQNILIAVAVIQFVWMLFNDKHPNEQIAEFGSRLGVWLKRVSMYQSGATDEKPFPWREID